VVNNVKSAISFGVLFLSAPSTKAIILSKKDVPASLSTRISNPESKASEGSSVNVNAHLKQIAQRESGGNIH
ncbi:transglycosylase family protein, partial [Staphylococcus aureus]|nr:transglycosylase family protein [Staphylococcus aureus]